MFASGYELMDLPEAGRRISLTARVSTDMDRNDIERLVAEQIEKIQDDEVRRAIERLMVTPHCLDRDWD